MSASSLLTDHYQRMLELTAELTDLQSAEALVSWDQEAKMPPRGIDGRSKVSATLAGLAHEKLTHPEYRETLEALRSTDAELSEEQRAQVREAWREVDRASRVPAALVMRFAETKSRAAAIWARARADKDFPAFAPILGEIMTLSREVADALGHQGEAYNALLDEYEPGARADDLARVLGEVRDFLVPVVQAIRDSGRSPDLALVEGPYDVARQEQFGLEVVKVMGFDLEAGRIDTSQHPFCSGIHTGDVRLCTRYKDDFRVGFLGTVHEAGHGMYEQGISPGFMRTPLGRAKSLGIHESQSRMWENNIALGLPFWRHFFPRLRELFPEHLVSASVEAFHGAMNDVRPSFIRIEADEVTYNLHIVLRFEIERELMRGAVKIDALPDLWNTLFEKYLGLVPPSPELGVLQDIHWAFGLIGYFPTYTLGSLNAAQIHAAAQRGIPDLDDRIAKGELLPLKEWLQENIHRHGCRYSPRELMVQATGKPTDAGDFIAYINGKYGPLYGI